MFQFAFEAVLFKFTYAPQFAPLLVLPPTSATARQKHRKAHTISLLFNFSFLLTLQGGIAPPVPLCGYAAKGSSQEGEPPMLQLATEAAAFKYTNAPQPAPLLVLPPTSATARIVTLIQ